MFCSNFKDNLEENKRKQPNMILHDGGIPEKIVCSGSAPLEHEYSQSSLNLNWRIPADCLFFFTDCWHYHIRAQISHLPQESFSFLHNSSILKYVKCEQEVLVVHFGRSM
ncbi:hypothetical protein ILYODFUR_028414 [Ilyodon furcidens]|uniref:Uncharacterized protein n=1 Tax=Ilyodon furcidens TaxID=33524 RepID=A0ABV0UJZ0_9TELE